MSVVQHYVDAISSCGIVAQTTKHRAVFKQNKEKWQLVSLLLGGTDDLYIDDESNNDPC